MKFVLDNGAEIRVQGYDPGEIRLALPRHLAGDLHVDPETGLATLASSFLLGRTFVDPRWPPAGFGDLNAEHLAAVLAHEPELVLVGTGDRLQFPADTVLRPLQAAGIGYEIMDTPAACRTFNILAAEDRLVVAALLLPGT